MKIFAFQAGLGNQFFQYAYYQYLCRHFPSSKFYGFYPKRALHDHNGLEIDKWFDVELPKSSRLSNIIATILFWINKLFEKMQLPYLFTDSDRFRKPDSLFYLGYWQDKKYYQEVKTPSFRTDLKIGQENERFLKMISESNSVAVHVRRGDYINYNIRNFYGNICTIDYYKRAILEIRKRVKNPIFFFFSDDITYVEEHFNDINKVIVSCNKGMNSFWDMYLMAHCKNMILANSTFSCCAAYLNKNQPLVICPSKWNNGKRPPVLAIDNWIRLK